MCSCSYLPSMKTRGPRDCSTATAIGWLPKRAPSIVTQAPTASGLCSISPRSRRSASAGCSDQTCLLSPQSMATKAAKRGSSALFTTFISTSSNWAGALFPRMAYSRVLVVRTASENVVRETKRLPLRETLLVNIGCWPVELVAAGGLLNPIYADSSCWGSAADAASLDSAERGKGSQTPTPCPAPPSPLGTPPESL